MSAQLPVLEQPQQSAGSVWNYVSPSRLNCWLTCPLKWRFKYIDGITTPSLFIGQRCHAALEAFYRHRMLGISLDAADLVTQVRETWEEAAAEVGMAFENQAQETALRQQTADLVIAYVEQVPSDEPRPMAVEATMEVPLVDLVSGEDLGIPLLGITDLILDGEDGPTVVDFKTSSRSAPPFEVTHEIQLTSYGYLFRRTTGRVESELQIRSLIKTKSPKIEIHSYPTRSEAHFSRLFSVIREYLAALHSGMFNFRPGWGCGVCDFREQHCRRWCG